MLHMVLCDGMVERRGGQDVPVPKHSIVDIDPDEAERINKKSVGNPVYEAVARLKGTATDAAVESGQLDQAVHVLEQLGLTDAAQALKAERVQLTDEDPKDPPATDPPAKKAPAKKAPAKKAPAKKTGADAAGASTTPPTQSAGSGPPKE